MAKNAEEAALEYRQALDELKDNNKMQINLMTILAEDYSLFSKEIVDVIAQQVDKVSSSQKLAVMYVMDSVLKNVTDVGNYKSHIEKAIHRVFVRVFEAGDERTRLSLHKLRQTWVGIFQRSTLYKIDLAVHAIDPAWPVPTPQPHSGSGAPRPSTSVPVQHQLQTNLNHQQQLQQKRTSAKVHVNPHFFQKNSVVTGAAAATDSVTATTTATTPIDSKLPITVDRRATGPDPRLAKQPNTISVSPKSIIRSKGPSVVIKEELIESNDVDERVIPAVMPAKDGVRVREPRRMDILKRRSPPCALEADSTQDKKARLHLAPSALLPHSQQSNHDPQPPQQSTMIRPTTDLGAHAFVATATRRPPPSVQVPQVNGPAMQTQPIHLGGIAPAAITIPSTSVPQSMPMMPPGMTMMQHSGSPPLGPIMAAQHRVPAVPGTSTMPPVINMETPKLEGIPANNRIFVDGRAYEVSYINEVPVIERNGLPHRIYFTGVPRNVIIDGIAYQLAFGEEKRVTIDGEEHILRFGAPSRELYMGNYPFKGAFGGPPIFATINGIRHEIRLSGPPPEVKIEPDPCYELLRHMPRTANAYAPPKAAVTNGEQPTIDVKGLLAKLQRSGILSALNRRDETGSDSPNRPVTPPIPSEHRGEVTERLPNPPTDLKSFSMRALRIRYTSVVEGLHQQRRLCPNCGLRFNELKGEKYQRHLDWHFRENLRNNETSRCREWYLPVEVWLEFSEQTELSASASTSRPSRYGEVEEQTKEVTGVNAVACDAVSTKECGVCEEKFEEYWDEEDDIWKFKDCMIDERGMAFHPGCILDASAVRSTQMDDSPSEEEQNDKNSLINGGMQLKREFVMEH